MKYEEHIERNKNCTDYQPYIGWFVQSGEMSGFLEERIEQNIVIADKVERRILSSDKPEIGDYVKIDGEYFRLSSASGKHSQVSKGGRFCINPHYGTYSGGFRPNSFDLSDLKLTDETREGDFWFFSRGWSGAGNGVNFTRNFKVYEL